MREYRYDTLSYIFYYDNRGVINMNSRHRLIHKLEREEKRRKTRELTKLGEEVFESGFNPIVSLLPPILKKQNI